MEEKKIRGKGLAIDLAAELGGSVLIAAATVNVALNAGFPVAGFNGIAMLIYRFTAIPMGLSLLILNILPALICLRLAGRTFILKTLRCMLMSTILIDYVAPLFPVYTGDRMLAALVTGVFYGIGYGIILSRGSSTGGVDFLLIIVKAHFPHIKTGTITFALDCLIVVGAGYMYGDFEGIIYGLIVDYITSIVIDKLILGLNCGSVALIITDKGREICSLVDQVSGRGSTLFHAEGGYQGAARQMVMVAGNRRDISLIRRAVDQKDPGAFTIIMSSNEVNGEGFHTTRIAGE